MLINYYFIVASMKPEQAAWVSNPRSVYNLLGMCIKGINNLRQDLGESNYLITRVEYSDRSPLFDALCGLLSVQECMRAAKIQLGKSSLEAAIRKLEEAIGEGDYSTPFRYGSQSLDELKEIANELRKINEYWSSAKETIPV